MCKAAAYSNNTCLFAQYRRLAARCGKNKAMLAIGHNLLVIIYHVLSEKKSCEELGGNDFDDPEPQAAEKRFVLRLEEPGYQVSLQQPTLVVSTCEKRFGSEHPETITVRQHLTRIVSKREAEQDGEHHPVQPERRTSQSSSV